MAGGPYFWVGGSGTWDATTTTNWATSSGGTGGAGVPAATDNVTFDTLSNATAYTVTKVAGAVAGDVNASGPLVGSVSFAGVGVSVYGDFTLAATGVTWSAGGITFASTATGKTITTNGVTLATVTFNGVGGGWTLGSAFTTAAFTLTAGTFVTSNFAVTFTNFTSTSTSVRGLTLGSSLVTVTAGGTSTIWNVTNPGNLTVTPGTSTIRCTAATGKVFVGGGSVTYYNIDQGGAGYLQINGTTTFNDIQNSYVATGATSIRFQSNPTVANFTATGAVGKVLTLISTTAGTARTLTKTGGGTISVDYMSIQDSTAAGTGATWYAGANSTNVSNNTGWIFTAPPGGAYAITANNGSYSVTGQASSILVSRLLFGAFGSYTVAGQNASVTYSPGPSPTPAEIQLLIKLRSFTERRRF